jgi:hypothetical protein
MMEKQIIVADITQGRSNLVRMLLNHARMKIVWSYDVGNGIHFSEGDVPDTPLEEFEKGLDDLLGDNL